jgi:hypothetical protein
MSEDEIRPVLAGNAADLYGADLDFLQGIADRVGPTVDELSKPLEPDEMPADPNFLMLVNAGASLSALNKSR